MLIPFIIFPLLKSLGSSQNSEQLEKKIHEIKEIFVNRVSYDLEPFREIVVGPSAHQDLVLGAVKDFIIENTGYGRSRRSPGGTIEVGTSQIPYRVQ